MDTNPQTAGPASQNDMPVSMPPNTIPPPLDSEPAKRHPGVMIAIVVLAVLLLGGIGTAYAAMQGWITLPFGLLASSGNANSSAAPTLEDVARATAAIESGSMTLSLAFQVQPKQSGTPVLPNYPKLPKEPLPGEASSTIDLDDDRVANDSIYSQYLSTDTKLTFELVTDFQSGGQKNSEGRFKGTYSSSGLALTADASFRRITDDIYVQVNALPLPILDFAAISGMWVKLDGAANDGISLLGMGMDTDAETQVWKYESQTTSSTDETLLQKEKRLVAEYKILNEELLDRRAFTLGDGERMTVTSGTDAWRYAVTVHPRLVREAIVAAVDRRPEGPDHPLLSDGLKKSVDREEFVTWLTELTKMLTSHLDVDPQTHVPLRQSFRMHFAPDESGAMPKNQEYVVELEYVLRNVNQPVFVEVPAEAITLKKAGQIVSHKSDAQVLLDEQSSLVSSLRDALSVYNSKHKTYPASLSELIGTASYSRTVVNVPADRYTKQPFAYTRAADGKSYSLAYRIELPKEKPSGRDAYLYDYQSEQYVDGMNTANEKVVSVEALEKKDSDKDGLSDAIETKLGTNRYRADTDGDGYTDKEESDSGNNPLVNGKTGKVIQPY